MSKELLHDSAASRWQDFFLVVLAACFAFGISTVGFAQNWQIQPTILLTADFNDNIRLDEGDSIGQGEVTGGVLRAGARIWRQSPTGVARFRPVIRSSHYGTNADSDDYYLDAFFQHTTQKSEWVFEARYSDEEVLSAELNDPDFDDPDIDNPVNDDSGVVATESRRDRVVVGPRVKFQLSQRTTLWFSGQLIDTGYESLVTSYVDFTNSYLEGGIGRALSKKNSIGISVFGRNYDPDIEGSKSESYGSFATFNRRISERNSVFVRAGYENVDISQLSSGQNEKRSEGSALFGAGIRSEFKTSRMVLDVQHSVAPSGIAQLRERNMFRIRYVRDFSELTSAAITARYEETSSLSEASSFADRDFARVELRLERRLNRAWSAIGGYRYTRQEFSGASDVESSNALYLGVQYSPPRQQ